MNDVVVIAIWLLDYQLVLDLPFAVFKEFVDARRPATRVDNKVVVILLVVNKLGLLHKRSLHCSSLLSSLVAHLSHFRLHVGFYQGSPVALFSLLDGSLRHFDVLFVL